MSGLLAAACWPLLRAREGHPGGRLWTCCSGSGVALVLDEFALILHWTTNTGRGRCAKSIDAVFLGATLTGMLVLGALPSGLDS